MIIAIFSFIVAPLLQFAPDGLWQIIRIFTGFYNIPVIAIVLVGFFTRHVPALGAKIAVVFHIIAYALLKFVINVEINFIHIYAILFTIEVIIMLTVGYLKPVDKDWSNQTNDKVSLKPWKYAWSASATLFSSIVIVYLIFSPIGIVGGFTNLFWILLVSVLVINTIFCVLSVRLKK